MLPTLKSLGELKGKRVLVRVDFNVPLKDGRVPPGAEWRLKAVLPTLDYLAGQGARVIILSHLGRPEGKKDLRYSLYPVFLKLTRLWPQHHLAFGDDVLGPRVIKLAKSLKNGEAALLENLRFYSGEENNESAFAQKLSQLGEFYVNDAFAASHRAHASIVGFAGLLKSAAGLLLEKEIAVLAAVRNKPRRPLVFVLGGAKAETKLGLVKEFMPKSEAIVLGGVLANTLLFARGVAVGRSVIEEGLISEAKKLELTSSRLHLPLDVVVSKSLSVASSVAVKAVGRVAADEFIVDIGPDTIKLFKDVIGEARMVVWNGTLGLTELPAFRQGSLALARAVSASQAEKIVGGGDLVNFLTEEDLVNKMTYVSSGGGAMMEFLAGETLPGLAALEQTLPITNNY
ncbi:MAG: phosphoglycerate kinase [Parcubacteria group bacterium]|nr:phosphoglycerate kinase [Parcubacteria group bacterium]